MSDYLLRGAISNAVNFPSITAEEAPRLKPFIALAERLGSFAGQLTESDISKLQISYEGAVAQMNTKALSSAAIAGFLRPMLEDMNVVSAPIVAKERGIVVEETTRAAEGDYESLITVTVTSPQLTRWVSGTVYADGRPRIVNIKGIRMDAEFGPSMIYITNLDKPGFIGRFSSTLGDAGINIATFHVGREAPGANAIALIEIDGELPHEVLAKVRALPQVQQARPLKFIGRGRRSFPGFGNRSILRRVCDGDSASAGIGSTADRVSFPWSEHANRLVMLVAAILSSPSWSCASASIIRGAPIRQRERWRNCGFATWQQCRAAICGDNTAVCIRSGYGGYGGGRSWSYRRPY